MVTFMRLIPMPVLCWLVYVDHIWLAMALGTNGPSTKEISFMLKRLFAGSLVIPLAAFALSGCGDDGGGGGTDAARPDAADGTDGGGTDGGVDGGGDFDRTIDSVAGGRFEPLGPYQGIRGAAHLVRMKQAIKAELYVEGLTPDIEYIAHVHRLPCEENSAGTHYKHDPAIVDESEDNEVWLRFTTDASGIGKATTEQLGLIARMDAQAIVIHDPAEDGAKMACANLRFDDAEGVDVAFEGAFTTYSDAPAADANIAGTAALTVALADGEATISLDVEGLDETATYAAHVHELPCEVNKAGGHYKRDTTVVDEQEDNEIWPDVTLGDAQVFDHAVRYDAQSIVIHRVEATASPKVACANLVRQTEIPEYVIEGTGDALQGVGNDYRDIEAIATLTRKKDGSTQASLSVTGLPESITGFGAHVHAGTCELDPPGGPHYKVDASIEAEAEANEIWLNFSADAQGTAATGNDKPTHLARPDAISVVIHEPATNTRLSCVELQ